MKDLIIPENLNIFLCEHDIYIYKYSLDNKNNSMKIFLDSNKNPITADICFKFHKLCLEYFPKSKNLSNIFVSEVCSIGLNKELKTLTQLNKSIGEKVKINLKTHNNEIMTYVGELINVNDSELTIKTNKEGNIVISRDNIKNISEIN